MWRLEPPAPPPKPTWRRSCGQNRGGDETGPTRISQPRVAPRPNLVDAAVFCHAVSELLLAGHLPKNIAARNGSLLHRAIQLWGAEGGLAHETDAPCGRGSRSDPDVANRHYPPRRCTRPPRRATEHAGGRSGHPARSAGGHPVDGWRPVIRLPVFIHLVLSLTCSCAGHPTRDRI